MPCRQLRPSSRREHVSRTSLPHVVKIGLIPAGVQMMSVWLVNDGCGLFSGLKYTNSKFAIQQRAQYFIMKPLV